MCRTANERFGSLLVESQRSKPLIHEGFDQGAQLGLSRLLRAVHLVEAKLPPGALQESGWIAQVDAGVEPQVRLARVRTDIGECSDIFFGPTPYPLICCSG